MFMNEICNLCNDAHKDNLDDIFKTRSYGASSFLDIENRPF